MVSGLNGERTVMGATLTVTDDTATEMVRLVGDKLVVESSQRNLYIVPPKPDTFEWMITGYATPFKMKKKAEFIKPGDQEFQWKTRLEYTITDGQGKGRMFTDMYTFSIHEKATLGKLVRRLKVDLTPDAKGEWDLDRLVGYSGKSYVGHGADASGTVKLDEMNKPKYAQIVVNTVELVSAPTKKYSIELEEAEPVTSNGNGHATESDDGWPTG